MCIKRILKTFFLILLLAALTTGAQAADLSSQAGKVKISSGWLNVRSGPNTGAGKVASLKNGSYVTILSRSGDWWRVEYASGKTGYCHGSYIAVLPGEAKSVSISSGTLNVRSGPGTGYSRTGRLSKGEAVIPLSVSGSWTRVLYQGSRVGYVSSQYLGVVYRQISLSAPNLKQMDSRWADKTIGESGRTFAEIGCATTAIAIVESHRQGRTVYPDDMARELRYTPSGSVYWPADYRAVTSGTDYLTKIYNRLAAGQPVLLGLKNRYGGQHWVVVTGFSGGSALTAAGFTIRDPGSNSRTNLQQLLDVYPYFYKMFLW